MRKLSIVLVILAIGCSTNQTRNPITADTGLPLTAGLAAWDPLHYTLRHDIRIDRRAIAGSATIRFRADEAIETLELDFDGRFRIDRVEDESGTLEYTKDEAKLYVGLRKPIGPGETGEVTVSYHGRPLEAKRPPWQGGFVWAKTPSGKPWVVTAFEGEGCDIWWPCKDHPSGEPAGFDLFFSVPAGLTVASNGVLVEVTNEQNGRRTFHWRTGVPTNPYGVALNVGPYVLFEDSYESSNGTDVPLKFWAIEEHADRAETLFRTELKPMVEFFERRIGPYPWGQEKLGIVETPHLGMEHQTITAYGNQFRRDKYGFDWLMQHELSHEWFGNVMTCETNSDMWLHEGFGAYMQPLYTREVMGDAAFYHRMYQAYLGIRACNPIAPRETFSGDRLFDEKRGGPGGDIYPKGAWVLHSLRYVMGEEAFWRAVRRLVYDTPHPETLEPPIQARFRSTDDFLGIASNEAGEDLDWFFEVYVRRGPLPVLQVTESDDGVLLEWQVEDDLEFPMPVPVRIDGKLNRVEFEGNRALLRDVEPEQIQIDPFMQILRKLPSLPTCEERKKEERKRG